MDRTGSGAVGMDILQSAGFPAMGMIDKVFRIHPEFLIQHFGRKEGDAMKVIDPVFLKPSGNAFPYVPYVRERAVVPQGFLEDAFIQISYMLRYMLGHNVHGDFRQKKIGSHPCGGADAGPFIHSLHHHLRQCHAVLPVHGQIGRSVNETFVNGIGVHVFCRKEMKIHIVNICRHFHIEPHPRQGRNVFQGRRDFNVRVRRI